MIRPGDVCVVVSGIEEMIGELVVPFRQDDCGFEDQWLCDTHGDKQGVTSWCLFEERELEVIGHVRPVTAEELLIDALKRYGYDGLYWECGEETCGCSLDDFTPCNCINLSECVGGYKRGKRIVPRK